MKRSSVLLLPMLFRNGTVSQMAWHRAWLKQVGKESIVLDWPMPSLASHLRSELKLPSLQLPSSHSMVQAAIARLSQSLELEQSITNPFLDKDDWSVIGTMVDQLRREGLVYLMASMSDGVSEVLNWLEDHDYIGYSDSFATQDRAGGDLTPPDVP